MPNRWDMLTIAGLGTAGVGMWLWSPALALTVIGAMVMVAGLAGDLRAPRRGAGGD